MAGDVRSSSSQIAGLAQPPDTTDPARPGISDVPLALYRRYRPATFAEVKGQDHVTGPLRQALRSGRVHHAYLFSGPRGCGKTSSARILARSLNCEEGPTPDPCGKCASCIALGPTGAGSIDVIEIDAASHGGIDDARDLRERAFYSPVAARYKIYIIDEAHMVTSAGFNALLKLVEEPPPHLKFVFATTEPEKVIPTIRSRTHHYPFRLVPPTVLRELLEEILGAEGISYEPSILPVVIRAGAGSVRDTLSVVDQLIAGSDESGLRYDRAIALLGYTDDALLDEMADAFAVGDGAAVFVTIDRVVEAGHDPRRFAMDLLDRMRDLIVIAAVPGAAASGLLDVPEDRLERMRGQAASFGQERLVGAAETVSSGLVDMRGATSPRLLLELMCAQVLLPADRPAVVAPASGGVADVLTRVERLERQLSAAMNRSSAAGPDGERAVTGRQRPEDDAKRAVTPHVDSGDEPAGPVRPPEARRAEHPRGGVRPAGQPEPPHAAPPQAARHARAPEEGVARAAGRRVDHDATPSGQDDRMRGVIDTATLRDRWPQVLDSVREVRKTAWILLSNYATIDSVESGVLTLAFDSEGNAKGFASSGSDGDLADVLGSMFGARLTIRTTVRPTAARGRPPVGAGPAKEIGAAGPREPDQVGEPLGSVDSDGPGGPNDSGEPREVTIARPPASPNEARPDEPGLDEPGLDEPGLDEPGRGEPGPGEASADGNKTDRGSASPRSNSRRRGQQEGNGPAGSRQRSNPGSAPGPRARPASPSSRAKPSSQASPVGMADPSSPAGPSSLVGMAELDLGEVPRVDSPQDQDEASDELTGTELIMRELGGRVIEER